MPHSSSFPSPWHFFLGKQSQLGPTVWFCPFLHVLGGFPVWSPSCLRWQLWQFFFAVCFVDTAFLPCLHRRKRTHNFHIIKVLLLRSLAKSRERLCSSCTWMQRQILVHGTTNNSMCLPCVLGFHKWGLHAMECSNLWLNVLVTSGLVCSGCLSS